MLFSVRFIFFMFWSSRLILFTGGDILRSILSSTSTQDVDFKAFSKFYALNKDLLVYFAFFGSKVLETSTSAKGTLAMFPNFLN